MTGFSQMLIERSGYDSEGFAEIYDCHRPSPPSALLRILTLVSRAERPRLVVDLGAGTGLSTRAWAGRAEKVVGIEPNPAMIERARGATKVENVRYIQAFAADTGLPGRSADLVTCAQAFHWMEPGPVLAEAARALRPGGVFAAYDYDVPPIVHPELDEAFAVCHAFGETDVGRIVGLAESVGGPRALFCGEAPEVEASFARLCESAHRVFGTRSWPVVFCYRIRLGVT